MNDEEGLATAKRERAISVTFVSDNAIPNIIRNLSEIRKGNQKNASKNKCILAEGDNVCAPIKTNKNQTKMLRRDKENVDGDNVDDDVHGIIDDLSLEEKVEKPTELFEDGDIAGDKLFWFQTPKRKDGMAVKASESAKKTSLNQERPSAALRRCSTPNSRGVDNTKTLVKKTPSKNDAAHKGKENQQQILSRSKTPYSLRTRLKRQIQAQIAHEAANSESEYSDSDYSESEADEEDSDSSKSSSSSSSSEVEGTTRAVHRNISQVPELGKRRRSDINYVFTSDAYFESQSNKLKTSDHTLSKLKTPSLCQDSLKNILSEIPLSHEAPIKTLVSEHVSMFDKWRFILSEGFNILVYGLGSKRSLLSRFHREVLQNSPVLVVNGFFPSLTIKEILDGIAGDLLELRNIPTNPHDIIEWLTVKLSSSSRKRVYMIVHNLDGPMLQSNKAQTVMSQLAKIPHVHLIASVDHINCPLLWDHNKLSDYNFIWEDATSFVPYLDETSFETSLLVQKSGSLALASLSSVFQSLTKNAKEIFKLILEDHLDNKATHKHIGIHLSELYRKCRDAMLVTSDLALRTQLTEFIDHQLVKWRRDSEHLYIPIESNILVEFKKQCEEKQL